MLDRDVTFYFMCHDCGLSLSRYHENVKTLSLAYRMARDEAQAEHDKAGGQCKGDMMYSDWKYKTTLEKL